MREYHIAAVHRAGLPGVPRFLRFAENDRSLFSGGERNRRELEIFFGQDQRPFLRGNQPCQSSLHVPPQTIRSVQRLAGRDESFDREIRFVEARTPGPPRHVRVPRPVV